KMLIGDLPQKLSAIDIDSVSLPSTEISGDFYDFVTHSDQAFDFIVVDVMGKGVAAAFVASAIKNGFNQYSRLFYRKNPEQSHLEEVMNHMHSKLTMQLIQLEYFACLFYGHIDLE